MNKSNNKTKSNSSEESTKSAYKTLLYSFLLSKEFDKVFS